MTRKLVVPILTVTVAILSILSILPTPIYAASTGTAWGTLLLGPQCGSGICILQLTTGSGDLTVVTCYSDYVGPCSVIPQGDTVIVPVSSGPVLCQFSPYPTMAFRATGLPQHYH